jgi:hypothetical protein
LLTVCTFCGISTLLFVDCDGSSVPLRVLLIASVLKLDFFAIPEASVGGRIIANPDGSELQEYMYGVISKAQADSYKHTLASRLRPRRGS